MCRGVCLCACNHVQTQVCVAGRCWVGRDSQDLHWQLCGWLSGQRVTSNSSSEVSGEKALEHLPEGGHPELSAGLGCGLSAEAPNCRGRKRGGWLQRGSRRAARWLQWAWDPGAEPPSRQSREGGVGSGAGACQRPTLTLTRKKDPEGVARKDCRVCVTLWLQ